MSLTPAQRQARYRAAHPDRVRASKERCRERDKAWRAANKERLLELGRQSYARHKERIATARRAKYDAEKNSVRNKADYRANKAARLAAKKAWRENNQQRCNELHKRKLANEPEKWSAYFRQAAAARRTVAKKAKPSWADTVAILNIYRLARHQSKCLGIKFHVDHIVPLQSTLVCGLHVEDNLQIVPATLNHKKSNRVWPDMPGETA